MVLKNIQQQFTAALANIYSKNEAENIWYITLESLTGFDFKRNHQQKFMPDGCFIEMLKTIEKRLLKHEPIQYILNEAWFYDLPFFVDTSVLIPRPETEELVHWMIKENKTADDITILDIGTGSGCIPVILKNKIPQANVYACDVSEAAIHTAKKNAAKHKAEINFLLLDILNEKDWAALPLVDIIVSNPPYIPESDKGTMQKNVLQYEPHTALFVKNDNPLIFYEAIANIGKSILKRDGRIYMEIHEALGRQCQSLFQRNNYTSILQKDMQGKDRMIKAGAAIV